MAEDNVNEAPVEEAACQAPAEGACQVSAEKPACEATPEGVYQAPTEEQIVESLTGKFPDIVIRGTEARRVYATADRSFSWDVCKYIHDFLTFEHCSTVIGVDYIDHLTVVYHLSNYYTGGMIELSVDVPVDDPHVKSVACIWEGANWHERETWELFGIVFDGHTRLERLITQET